MSWIILAKAFMCCIFAHFPTKLVNERNYVFHSIEAACVSWKMFDFR